MTGTDPRADLSVLDVHKAGGFVPGYPATARIFYSPVDDIHNVLVDCVQSAKKDVLIGMYGFDDDNLVDVLLEKMNSEHVNVELTLDKSQAGGVHEKKLLDTWRAGAPATSITIGNSEKHAIMHLKMGIIDGILTFNGSTNWSDGGENRQDNELTVHLDALVAAEAAHRLRAIRLAMLAAESPPAGG